MPYPGSDAVSKYAVGLNGRDNVGGELTVTFYPPSY